MNNKTKKVAKEDALQLGLNTFAEANLKQKYLDLISHI
jgi:hypothetical protein